MNDTVLVRGDGVAAACCVRSLSESGLRVSVVRAGRPKLSVVLLGEATQFLITDPPVDRSPEFFPGRAPDHVRPFHQGHAVGDENRGPAAKNPPKHARNCGLRNLIECGARFARNQNSRISNERMRWRSPTDRVEPRSPSMVS